jgi:ABC-type multidrug transport system fused ATPase/permease subunit
MQRRVSLRMSDPPSDAGANLDVALSSSIARSMAESARRRCAVLLVACSLRTAAAGADIEFRNVDFEVNKGKIKVLQQVHGRARPGRVLGIMGPSGSGKTSLLNALAGTTRATKGSRLTGALLIDGRPATAVTEQASGVRSAYVRQQDVFYAQMTVRETLMFSARLRLPSNVSAAEREALVDGLLRKLSLVKVADTIVGDIRKRGISGCVRWGGTIGVR